MKEFYIDSKKDVDRWQSANKINKIIDKQNNSNINLIHSRQLKVACEEFINHVTGVFVGSLQEFLNKVSKISCNHSERCLPKWVMSHP